MKPVPKADTGVEVKMMSSKSSPPRRRALESMNPRIIKIRVICIGLITTILTLAGPSIIKTYWPQTEWSAVANVFVMGDACLILITMLSVGYYFGLKLQPSQTRSLP